MARIRTIKPEFFRDEQLQDIQAENPELHPMLVFAGLWTVADKNGVFEWLPRTLKLDILPFLQYDMVASLSLLERFSLISRFTSGGKDYGVVVNFSKHQRISGKEAVSESKFPFPSQGSVREAPEKPPDAQEGKGVQEREGKGEGEIPPDLHPNQYASRLLQEIGYPEAKQNIIAVASAIDAEVKLGRTKPAAYEYILACTRDLIDQGAPITTFTFTEAKYRPESRRNTNGQSKPSASAERSERSKRNILDGFAANARRANPPDDPKRKVGAGA